jgi:hypothetical protein
MNGSGAGGGAGATFGALPVLGAVLLAGAVFGSEGAEDSGSLPREVAAQATAHPRQIAAVRVRPQAAPRPAAEIPAEKAPPPVRLACRAYTAHSGRRLQTWTLAERGVRRPRSS